MAVDIDKLQPHDLVLIGWVDSTVGDPGWEEVGVGSLAPAFCKTAGFVWDIGRDYITLVPTVSKTQILGRLTIPKISIMSCEKTVVVE